MGQFSQSFYQGTYPKKIYIHLNFFANHYKCCLISHISSICNQQDGWPESRDHTTLSSSGPLPFQGWQADFLLPGRWTGRCDIPSGNLLHSYWTRPSIVDLPIKKLWFSIAMLVYQRVYRDRNHDRNHLAEDLKACFNSILQTNVGSVPLRDPILLVDVPAYQMFLFAVAGLTWQSTMFTHWRPMMVGSKPARWLVNSPIL